MLEMIYVSASRYLQKLSTRKKWQSRYFELSGHYLKYFEDKNTDRDDDIKGAIDLAQLRFCTVHQCDICLEMADDDEIKVGGTHIQHRIANLVFCV